MSGHLTALDWARHLAGEAGWRDGWRRRRHLRGCPACRAEGAALAADRGRFDADPARGPELARLQVAAQARPTPGARPAWPGLAWGGAALALALVALVTFRPGTDDGPLAAKGAATITLVVARSAGTAPLGDRCAPGDRLMASWRTTFSYLLLMELDGRGRAQALHPRDGAASARLAGPAGATPGSWILDDTPGRECFAAFFSEAPLAAEEAARALVAAPTAPALAGATVVVRCCDKGGPW